MQIDFGGRLMLESLSKFRKIAGTLMGLLDYCRAPGKRDEWEGAFNNQEQRQEIFLELISRFRFDAIVETGTYRGMTTQYMHRQSNLPLYTVEHAARIFGFAWMRMLKFRNIHVRLADSRSFLKSLSQKSRIVSKRLFFYLDSHWQSDLPLREELEIIFQNWHHAIVMIDDFRVPMDPGFGFDHYGQHKELNLEYLAPLAHLQLTPFFPSQSSAQETGAKRGCVVLARAADSIATLRKITSLHPWLPTSSLSEVASHS